MSYRPITDVWILARPKVKFYGAYPNGFLERALPLIGASEQDNVLHLCGGRAKDYPNKRLVANAVTVDCSRDTDPDLWLDITDEADLAGLRELMPQRRIRAALVDPPYTLEDHAKYDTRGIALPTANHALRVGLQLVPPGGRVGVLHYAWPQPPKTARSIACIGVIVGFNNRMRCFSVFERIAEAVSVPAQARAGGSA